MFTARLTGGEPEKQINSQVSGFRARKIEMHNSDGGSSKSMEKEEEKGGA